MTGCTGGRTQTPLEPPKLEDTPTPNPIGSTKWIRYENELFNTNINLFLM